MEKSPISFVSIGEAIRMEIAAEFIGQEGLIEIDMYKDGSGAVVSGKQDDSLVEIEGAYKALELRRSFLIG